MSSAFLVDDFMGPCAICLEFPIENKIHFALPCPAFPLSSSLTLLVLLFTGAQIHRLKGCVLMAPISTWTQF